jgi:hypothetical protein
MRNIVRVAAVLALALCIAGAGYAKKDGKDVGPKRTLNTAPAPVLQGNLTGTVIFQEGFNDSVPPAGWIMINNDGNESSDPTDPSDTCWYQSTSTGGTNTVPPQEGSAFAAAYWGTSNGTLLDDWLVTPNTGGSAPGGSVDSLVFWIASRLSTSGSYPDSLDIRVSTSGKTVNSFTTRLAYLNAPKTGWTRVALLLPQSAIRYIAFRYLLYDGGETGSNSDKVCLDGVQIIQYTSTAVGEVDGLVPGAFALGQNYPNPFNPSTQIEFALQKNSYARLAVYDALGREVATLVDGELSAGAHVRSFDASGLAGGVYFYRLSSGTFNETRRMLLLK